MSDQESRDDELIAELRGFAEGSTSARASLMRDAADAIERLQKHPEPQMEYWADTKDRRCLSDDPDTAARWQERGLTVHMRTKAVPAGPWLPVEGEAR